MMPLVGWGVRIHHRVAGYPEKIVFWYLSTNPQVIVNKIGEWGYPT
jgi:hypothetical protein